MNNQHVVVVVDCRIRSGKVDELMVALGKNIHGSKTSEPGCLQFDVLRAEGDPTRMLVYEVYEDEAALEAHQKTTHFKRFLEEGIPLFESQSLSFFRRIAP